MQEIIVVQNGESGIRSCSVAFNGSTVDDCNDSVILSANLRPQLPRATLDINVFSSLPFQYKKAYPFLFGEGGIVLVARIKRVCGQMLTLCPPLSARSRSNLTKLRLVVLIPIFTSNAPVKSKISTSLSSSVVLSAFTFVKPSRTHIRSPHSTIPAKNKFCKELSSFKTEKAGFALARSRLTGLRLTTAMTLSFCRQTSALSSLAQPAK